MPTFYAPGDNAQLAARVIGFDGAERRRRIVVRFGRRLFLDEGADETFLRRQWAAGVALAHQSVRMEK
jgi:hypothetical protein